MNKNTIITEAFSNPESEQRYRDQWPDDPALLAQHDDGQQCGGCTFYAPFNADYGLCCQQESPHYTETVFEHFTCSQFVNEGWGAHSFRIPRTPCEHCGGFGHVLCNACDGI
jgi:hypothetical protein